MDIRLRLCAVGVAASLSLPVTAATYYVSTSGSDGNAGTDVSKPWRTMRKGLQALRAGDTLIVRGGTYAEILGGATPVRIYPGTSTSPINVRAYPGERPLVQGLLWLSKPHYWTVDGIDVTWATGQSSKYHMVRLVNGIGWTFRNAEVWGARSFAGILIGSTVSSEPKNWRVEYCVIHDTYAANNTNQDHLIYANTGLTAGAGVIERNILYNASNGNGIKVGGAASSEGASNITIRYNTIYNAKQGILVSWLSKNNTIYRNIIQKVATNYSCARGYQLNGTNNLMYENLGYQASAFLWNDSGYVGIKDGGNWFPINPLFDSLTQNGFHPTNPGAAGYGRYATDAVP